MSAESSSPFTIGASVIRAHLLTMPTQAGVYRMLGADGTVLYVGKAKNLKKRVAAYTQAARLPHRLQRMVAQTKSMEIVVTATETEALLLEANLIQRFMPPFNVLLRDDKSYPYILITRDHDFPQMVKHRGSRNHKGWYFGPFASAAAVGETLGLLQRGFMLRNCSDSMFASRTRPCLQYHIKRCTAPCVGYVSKEDYARQVTQTCDFLRGKTQDIQKQLAEDMQRFSEAQEYEIAAILRDRIRVLTGMQSRQDINVEGLGDADVIAAHQENGSTAIQVFFFRGGRNYGTRAYFPSHDKSMSTGEIMGAFIAQFYSDKPVPPLLLLSDEPDDCALLAEALTERAEHTPRSSRVDKPRHESPKNTDLAKACLSTLELRETHKVEIFVPKLGDKKRLVEHARQNAKAALGRKMSESAEQNRLLSRVAEFFGMPEPPRRIEVYDNSHISGTNAVGAMIAAGAEGFLKKTYRKFNIKEATGGDDYAMMREVMTRRFRRLLEEDPERKSGMWPDLVLIDGGAGQLGKVAAVMNELGVSGVTLVAIAKGEDRNAGRERFFLQGRDEPLTLPQGDAALYYLQRLRDEAHRFAIGTHRAKRAKAISQSGLDEIAGIGAVRKRALLHHFGSGKAVSAARVEDLMRVEGISAAVAKKIHDHFHGGVGGSSGA